MMVTPDHLKDIISEDLGRESLVARLCVSTLDYILSGRGSVTRLSYASLVNVAPERPSPEELKAAVDYMTGDRAHVLDIAFEYIDEKNNKTYPLEPSEVQEARKEGYVVHPITGREIYDVDQYVVQFFKPTPELVEIKSNR